MERLDANSTNLSPAVKTGVPRGIYSVLGQATPSHKLQSRLTQLSQAKVELFKGWS